MHHVRASHNLERADRGQYGSLAMPQEAATPHNSRLALFIDIDSMLREFAQSPQNRPLTYLKALLHSLCTKLDGAFALFSKRRIAEVDEVLAPYQFCCAGLHGCETRDAAGRMWTQSIDARAFDGALGILSQLIERHPGLLLEDTGCGVILRFEHDPDLRVLAHTAMKSAADVLGPGFRLRPGKYTYDIHPSTATPATAIASFMEQAPFRGRTPVCIGDDGTDQEAFELVNGFRGFSVKIASGAPGVASCSITAMVDAIRWLEDPAPLLPPQGSCNCGWNPRDL